MIVDSIKNRAKYYALGDDIKAALDYFATIDDKPLEKANVTIPGTDVVVKVRPMDSKKIEDCSFEAHKEYLDIHYVAYGTECIGYADVEKLKEVSYNPESDAALLEGSGDIITLEKGYFMIVFTQDAHMPCICKDSPAPIGKMIAKIKE